MQGQDESFAPMKLTSSGSRTLAERLRSLLPGGDTRIGTFYRPYPLALAKGSGYRVWDVDDNEFIDLWANFTSLVHGYASPRIAEAIEAQARLGTAFPAPGTVQADLAGRLCSRIESIELVRFTNSGTEAVMLAVRAARAATGRDEVLKADGGYHGSWEQLPVEAAEHRRGVPSRLAELVHMVRFNDINDLEDAMRRRGERVAALIFEPVMGSGGVIPASPDFLRRARELADEYGCLLIFDEIITARLAVGGRQSVVEVTPDLTTLGKVIGGGLPIGAVGGAAEVMDVFNPMRSDRISHSGTFNGNALSVAAGCASLDLLDHAAIERLNLLGARLATGLREIFQAVGLPTTVTSCGSLVHTHFETPDVISTYADTNVESPVLACFHRAALSQGVIFAPRGMLSVSTPMDETVVDDVLDRLERAAVTTAQHGELGEGRPEDLIIEATPKAGG